MGLAEDAHGNPPEGYSAPCIQSGGTLIFPEIANGKERTEIIKMKFGLTIRKILSGGWPGGPDGGEAGGKCQKSFRASLPP